MMNILKAKLSRLEFMQIWLMALVVKSVAAVLLPFSNDEAYYWVWGYHPEWSYYDHPPMVGWLFTLGRAFDFFGSASRLPGVWLGHLTLLIWYKILSPHLDRGTLKIWLIMILFSPFFGLGSLIITPDVPFVFFWSFSILALLRALETRAIIWYLALGVSLGLGFCSKYLIVLFVPSALIWLFASGRWREVRWALVPATILTGLLFCAPVIYWNWRHEWASFAFQLGHGLVSTKRKAIWPLDYLGGQILLLFPVMVWLALRRREGRVLSWLHAFGWLPLAFFLYTSFRARVEANWPIMAHVSVLTLAVINASDSRGLKWLKGTVILWATVLLIVVSEVVSPWIPLAPEKLKTSEFTRFDAFLPELIEGREFYFGSYQIAGTISYKTRRQYYKLGGMNRRDHYDFFPQSYPKSDKFWLGVANEEGLPPWLIDKGYRIVATRELGGNNRVHEVVRDAQALDR